MRILVRTSRWAIWARRFGSFALPLALIPILMHRAGGIATPTFAVIEAVAIGFALLALLLSLCAFVRIWITGDHGWGRAVAGLVLALVCLSPVALWSADYLRYPMVDDVSTDAVNPPPLLSNIAFAPPPPALAQKIAKAFPNAKTRSYSLGAKQLFDLADKLALERQWDVRLHREPAGAGGEGQINAVTTTLFGFRDEISIRIAGDAEGSSIAMRSASLSALHEPGANGSRVEEFLTALDSRVTVLMKDQPAGTASDADAEPDLPPVPVPAPPRGKKR